MGDRDPLPADAGGFAGPVGLGFRSQLPDAMVQFDNHLGNTLYSPLPPPVVPAAQTLPQQEPGQRPRTS